MRAPSYRSEVSTSSGNPFDSDAESVQTRTATPVSLRPGAGPQPPAQTVYHSAPVTRRAPPPPPARTSHATEQQDQILPVSPRFQEITNEKYQPSHDVEAGAVPPRVIDSEKASAAAAAEVNNEKSQTAQDSQPKPSFFKRPYFWFRNIYCPIGEPALVLPYAPNDKEKLLYLNMGRFVFFLFGILSFLGLGAGMWLFTVTSPYFYFFALFAFISCFYMFLSYGIGLIGRNFDYEAHKKLAVDHPLTDETAPTVDIYLPCCHEPLEIIENTYKHIAKLDYPASKLKVYVMDDGNLDAVRALAEKYGFIYHVRDDRPHLRKAGNLRWNFTRTDGEYFIIYDADFCPRPDFVKELVVEHMADPKIAIVQTPQWFRATSDQTWVEQGAGSTQELFYRVIQVNRDKWGGAICVGTNAMYRRAALVDVGGTADIGHSEDVHTGFGAIDRGWRVRYMPLILATGICPNSPRAFFSQQMRWATGSTTLLTNTKFWTSNLTVMQKLCYFSGFLFYVTQALNIIIGPLPGILLLALRPEWVKVWNLAFAVPSYLYGLIIIPLWATSNYNYNVHHAMNVQAYAYLIALVDRVFSIEAPWAVSGDAKAHKSNKFRNMRIFCWFWIIATAGSMAGLLAWRLWPGSPMKWWDPLPLMIFTAYNIFKTHYFMFCNW